MSLLSTADPTIQPTDTAFCASASALLVRRIRRPNTRVTIHIAPRIISSSPNTFHRAPLVSSRLRPNPPNTPVPSLTHPGATNARRHKDTHPETSTHNKPNKH